METGTLSHKRTLKNLQERYDAGILEPNALDSNGLSLVHQFAYDGQVTCLKWLLKHGGDVTARSSEGCVAAHYAAAGGHLPILHLLKEEHSDCLDIKDNNHTYPLYIAAQEGQLDVVIWLTKYSRLSGSEPAKDGMTALHAAAQEGHLDCVRYLIQLAHCSPVQADYSGCTPLHFASAEGHWKVVKWLLEYGGAEADLRDKTGSAAIHLAAEYNRLKVLKILAKLNIPATLQDDTGRTPIDICIEKGHQECADFLKEWERQSSGEKNDHQRQSLKKVRFDKIGEKGHEITNEHEVQDEDEGVKMEEDNSGVNNNKEDYLAIAGQLAEDCLKEKIKRDKEEWIKASLGQNDRNDTTQRESTTRKDRQEGKGFKGGRNVGKRSSFKDKNVKYQVKEKNNNRDSLSMMIGKFQKKKPRPDYLSMTGERERQRPDLIQSVMQADRNASVGFRRRPSLEFFQDLRAQVKATNGKHNVANQEQSPRGHANIGEPVTIYQNGTLRSSRDNLNDYGHPVDVHGLGKDKENRGSVEAMDKHSMNIKDRKKDLTEISVQGTNDNRTRPVIKDGKSKKADKTSETDKQHKQKKLKLPKGFLGILPKSNSHPNMNVEAKERNSKNTANKNSTISSKSYNKKDDEYSRNTDSDINEHYLIRSLPLPTHGSHRAAGHEKISFYSYNLTNERKQPQSKWMSVRESFGSFFASLRSKRREKIYEVTDMTGADGSYHRKQDSKKFNIAKSLPIKKRKSISLEHMPNFSSTGEQIQVTNSSKSGKSTLKRLSHLQPGYTEPDIYRLTSMALDDTLKGKVVNSSPEEVKRKQAPKPEESLDFVVANKDVTGFQLESLQVNNENQKETGSALMW